METRAQTPLLFQRALMEEMKELAAGMIFHVPGKETMEPLNVYGQALPVPGIRTHTADYDMGTMDYRDTGETDAVFKCPWCLVKIMNGSIPEINGPQQVEVGICFGIYNNSDKNQGHMEILNLIQRVYERFAVNPILAGQYTCQGSFEWALQEEDTYPYFFGAIGTVFQFRGFRRESIFV